MAQQHTPGPWAVDSNGRYITYENPLTGTSFFLVHEPFVDLFKKEQAANMALIAAAPDLLAALINIIGWVPGREKWHTDAPIQAVESARAAIAKATGAKNQCEGCNGTGEVEKTIHRGDEGMEIEMDVMVECHECDGKGTN
jgi:hypothetical protein